MAVVDGDMIIGRGIDLEPLAMRNQLSLQSISDLEVFGLFTLSGRIWAFGVVPYKVSGVLPDQTRINESIEHWEAKTSIRFVNATTEDSFIEFVRSDSPEDCHSSVGRIGGRQAISLGDDCTKEM